MSTYIKPMYYASTEGGMWFKWTDKAIDITELNNYIIPIGTHPTAIIIPLDDQTGIQVHALAFGDPAIGWGEFPRWDCINGWTMPIEEHAPKEEPTDANEE